MAHPGELPKAFVACGPNAEKALEQFADDWPYGFFATGNLKSGIVPPLIPRGSEDEFSALNGLVVDVDETALSLAVHATTELSVYIEVLILLEDENKSASVAEEALIEKLKSTSAANLCHRGKCHPSTALLTLYANYLCGPDLVCCDLADIKTTLFGAKRFITVYTCTDHNRSASSIAQALMEQLQPFEIEPRHITGALLCFAGNIELMTQEFFGPCCNAVEAGLPEQTVFCTFTNMQSPERTRELTISLIVAIGGDPVQPKVGQKDTLPETPLDDFDLPAFLRSKAD